MPDNLVNWRPEHLVDPVLFSNGKESENAWTAEEVWVLQKVERSELIWLI